MSDTPDSGTEGGLASPARAEALLAASQAPPVVGIGAPAGCLTAFASFLQHMPPTSGLAFVLVQHLDPQQPSLLPEPLATHTTMPVLWAPDQTPVAANHVYLLLPNTAGTIAGGVLRLEPPTANGPRLPIDHFFRSLAADQGARAIGIVLAGSGADGGAGLAAILARGGLALVQAPPSAASPELSGQANDRGEAPYVLQVEAMPGLLLARAGRSADAELRSLNAELQAANEELQTSKEEIQSINEELHTVNAELKRKIVELDQTNADLANLFASTQIPAVFLHADGRIARFTPQATELFALIESDVGRPIGDLAARFNADELWPLIAQVLRSHTPRELVVHRPEQDRWWSAQIRPYQTLSGTVDGVVLTFADITALKRAEAVLQEAHDVLERRVGERTQDLALANAALQAQVVELARGEQARQQLLRQLVTAQEEERRHIARELHDQLGQMLTGLILGLKALHDSVPSGDGMAERVAHFQAMAVQIGQEVRSLAVQLRPTVLDDLGLELALSRYVEQWSAQAHVGVDLHTSGLDGERLPLAVETTLYRLVQEALTNVLKHARASEVSVIVERHRHEVGLIVEDDGAGFSTPLPPGGPDTLPPLGLLGMQERVRLLNGTLTIESAPGSGTTIFARLPLPGV